MCIRDSYEVDASNSFFYGAGSHAGKTLNISHNPTNFENGFQYGDAANSKDDDFGLSGWFNFSGDMNGNGDFNGDFQNCQEPLCTPTTVVTYDMDGCRSFGHDGSAFDYSEFAPAFPTQFVCSNVSASGVTRNSGAHSCIAGQGSSERAACFAAVSYTHLTLPTICSV